MGRKTYDMIRDFGTWPYGDRPTWVYTRESVDALGECNLQKQTSPAEAIMEARELGLKHLWLLGGGSLASELIDADLVDSVIVTQMPIILGSGIALADALREPSKLRLVSSRTTTSGLSQLNLEMQKNA